MVLPTLSIADASIAEGSSGGTTNLVFTVTLSAVSTNNVTVTYASTDGTALSASDYTATTATLTITAGSISGTITIIVNADTVNKADEPFALTLSSPVNATLGNASSVGSIMNDDWLSVRTYTYDANGNQTREVYYNGVGLDAIWFTADDVVNFYQQNTYDANGNQTRATYYNGAGLDGIWFSADDVVSSYQNNIYDANGNQTQSVAYSVGLDGVWFTADDVVSSYQNNTYDANGNQTRVASYSGVGLDGIWFTADDAVFTYQNNTYDANGKISKDAIWVACPPGTIFDPVTHSCI